MSAGEKKTGQGSSENSKLTYRWDQRVVFISRRFPEALARIKQIVDRYADAHGARFVPTESAISELSSLCVELLHSSPTIMPSDAKPDWP